jgi:hypothetical protein
MLPLISFETGRRSPTQSSGQLGKGCASKWKSGSSDKKEPRLRGQHTRRRNQKNLHPRSSEARQENFCPLDKDLSWKSFIGSGAVSWEYFEIGLGRQNWKPIMNLKYATFDFIWRQSKPPQPLLVHVAFYAPLDCNSQTTFPNARPSSAIGAYTNMSPADAINPSNTVVYRAAVELQKLDLQKSGGEKPNVP